MYGAQHNRTSRNHLKNNWPPPLLLISASAWLEKPTGCKSISSGAGKGALKWYQEYREIQACPHGAASTIKREAVGIRESTSKAQSLQAKTREPLHSLQLCPGKGLLPLCMTGRGYRCWDRAVKMSCGSFRSELQSCPKGCRQPTVPRKGACSFGFDLTPAT